MNRSLTRIRSLTFAAAAVLALGVGTVASAQTPFEATHPRRDQVNDRLENQNRRIHAERAEGEINGRQASRLHRADRRIRGEERYFARRDGGHVTQGEQGLINRQENGVSRRIGR